MIRVRWALEREKDSCLSKAHLPVTKYLIVINKDEIFSYFKKKSSSYLSRSSTLI
jgi:hypothetical protein